LDVIVNNAGIEITSLFVDLDAEQARKMLDVNVLGTALGIKHAFRVMRPGGAAGAGGTVINIASVAGTIAFPAISVYSASKSAVDRLTRVAAMESGKLGYGVRVNCVYPGLVPYQMGAALADDMARIGLFGSQQEAVEVVVGLTPSGRLASTEDIAAAVVFLASDPAAFINGAGLPVDRGMGTSATPGHAPLGLERVGAHAGLERLRLSRVARRSVRPWRGARRGVSVTGAAVGAAAELPIASITMRWWPRPPSAARASVLTVRSSSCTAASMSAKPTTSVTDAVAMRRSDGP
jgi:enoyl-[acyl-carrier-protein] reductase (NADH)